jgi:hypothetical protein
MKDLNIGEGEKLRFVRTVNSRYSKLPAMQSRRIPNMSVSKQVVLCFFRFSLQIDSPLGSNYYNYYLLLVFI